jgi:hypothetical protein
MELQSLYESAPKRRHLLWALPIGILICALAWWYEAALFNLGGFAHATRAQVEALHSESVTDYTVSGLVGSIPILLANWSRTLWPRLAVVAALVAVQLITGSIFILAPRAA